MTRRTSLTICLTNVISFILRSSKSDKCQDHDPATQLSQLLPPTPISATDLWIGSFLCNDANPPPSYDDSVTDLPPDYTSTDALAVAQTPEYTPFPSLNASFYSDVPNCLRVSCNTSPTSSLLLYEKSFYADIDFRFNDDGVRSHAKKKKTAAKKAANTSNAHDDTPKDEEPPPPAENPGGSDPPADGSGAGGGDDGDGGDGDKDKDKDKDKPEDEWGDAWADTGKKKKKSKKQAQEEEAARLKKEEEEAAAAAAAAEAKAAEEEAERIKKEEEEAAAAVEAEKAKAGPDLDWANDTPAPGDWAFSGATSKKKKKKGKVRRFGCFMTYGRALTNADG